MGPARVLGPELDGGERGKRGRGSEDSTARDMLQGKGSVQSRGAGGRAEFKQAGLYGLARRAALSG